MVDDVAPKPAESLHSSPVIEYMAPALVVTFAGISVPPIQQHIVQVMKYPYDCVLEVLAPSSRRGNRQDGAGGHFSLTLEALVDAVQVDIPFPHIMEGNVCLGAHLGTRYPICEDQRVGVETSEAPYVSFERVEDPWPSSWFWPFSYSCC